MPKHIQYLYRTKPVFDLCNQDNVFELYQMISSEHFLANIQLSEDGEVQLLSECTLDQIKAFERALIDEVGKNNLNIFFRAYIRNIFNLHELRIAIEEKTQISDSYPEEKQKWSEELDRKTARLEMLKRSNESSIKDIEKNCADLKAERNKYEVFQFVVFIFMLLPIVPIGFMSSIAGLIAVPVMLAAAALLEVKFFESGNSFYTNKLEELYAERSSLKEPISNLEMNVKSARRNIALFEQLNSEAQKQLQKLKEQQGKLEKTIANFKLEHLAPLNLRGTLSNNSIFKPDTTLVSTNPPEDEESLNQHTIL